MSGYTGPTVNAIEGSKDNILIQRVDQVKNLMSRIREKLIDYELFEKLHADCKVCLLNPDKCKKMKKCLQQMMDQGLVQIRYMKKMEDVSVIESQGRIPFEIPYQKE